jgi:transcriptional regulator with XRE-family HTH domain
MSKVTTVSVRIGKNVKKIREKKGITQEKLAFEANLNRAYIGYIERGERNPSTETLAKLAKALKVSLKDLL